MKPVHTRDHTAILAQGGGVFQSLPNAGCHSTLACLHSPPPAANNASSWFTTILVATSPPSPATSDERQVAAVLPKIFVRSGLKLIEMMVHRARRTSVTVFAGECWSWNPSQPLRHKHVQATELFRSGCDVSALQSTQNHGSVLKKILSILSKENLHEFSRSAWPAS